ncbi:MAG: SpoIIE family protein phosphatase [Clostridia bacterium]|nr:SpoIIE family protein phosphatase [Clostridia bacterium]
MFTRKTAIPSTLIYFFSAFALLLLHAIGNHGEPFGLALFYALGVSGANPFLIAVFYAASSLISLHPVLFFLYLGQAGLLCLAFLFERRFQDKAFFKLGALSFLTLFICLVSFVVFSPFTPYPIPFAFLRDGYLQKTVIAALVFLLSATFTVCIKALCFKLLKCRLRDDERIYCCFLFVLLGVGFCRFFGETAYFGFSLFFLLLFSCVTKDASALFFAFVASLPPFLVFSTSLERFFLYGVVIAFFMKSGRLAAAIACLATFFILGYFEGIYGYPAVALTQEILSALLPCLLFVFCPSLLIRKLENELTFYREKHLSRIAINRNRAVIGERLFEISSVFREIQTTFTALNESSAEDNAKSFILSSVMETLCKQCPTYPLCQKKNVRTPLASLIDVGCVKGKTNLMDIPAALADVCTRQTELLNAVNRQIVDYRRYMLESENATNGRNLLAGQALGVSEVLKNIALEQSEPLKIYQEQEKDLTVALLKAGVVCLEMLIAENGGEPSVSLVCYGETNVKTIADVISESLKTPMIISEKLTLSKEKFCYIFHRRPKYDAAFGIATRTKSGERASGDTYSVIKIDERRFLVALSDGMGSGEYAHKVSESTVSLLESFYRAKMPSALVLNTVNKLLSFNREESFACVDIAVVNLDDGETDVIKIGSPMGFILSSNAMKILEGSSLPLGILDSLRPATSAYTLRAGDVLLFLSDGITQAFPSTVDLYELLKGVPISNPQQLADHLLDTALELYGGEAKDDMTVLAVRLFQATA